MEFQQDFQVGGNGYQLPPTRFHFVLPCIGKAVAEEVVTVQITNLWLVLDFSNTCGAWLNNNKMCRKQLLICLDKFGNQLRT